MTREIFRERERAFENEFCRRVDQQLLERLRQSLQSEERLRALADATGIADQDVLRELDETGFSSECVVVLSLYPLVHVARADGNIDKRERGAVLEAAETQGHHRDSASYQLLEHWLDEPPSENLLTVWKDYVAAILGTMSGPGAKLALQDSLMKRARHVAAVSGGILGIHKVSDAEEAALAELAAAFDEADQ